MERINKRVTFKPSPANNVTNTYLDVGIFRSIKRGDFLILYLTDLDTGEVVGIRWDEVRPTLQAIARRFATDPLGLLATATPGDQFPPSNNPPPAIIASWRAA